MQNVQGLFVVKLSCKRPQVQVASFSSSNIPDESKVVELVHGSEERPVNKFNFKIELQFFK